jgi:acyl carrier protein
MIQNITIMHEGGRKMSTEEILEKVVEIVTEKLGVDAEEVTLDSDLTEDLGADSLDLVDLVMAFEDEFGVKIEDEDVENITTIGDIVDYISKELGVEED